jgi:hypothetical protein
VTYASRRLAHGDRSRVETEFADPKPSRGAAGSFAVRVTTTNPTAAVNVGASAYCEVRVHVFQFEGTARAFFRDAELRAVHSRRIPGVSVDVEFLRDVEKQDGASTPHPEPETHPDSCACFRCCEE